MMSKLEDLARALRSEELTRTDLADGTGVILHLESSQIYSLNETGMFFVQQLSGGEVRTDHLVQSLITTFSIDEITARRDLGHFVDELHSLLCT